MMDALNKKPFLSLIMIVKNEEAFLAQCLESVHDIVDEMVIVDTGSSDKTVEIAESFGAQIYHHPWQNSFSEARNYGLPFAKGEWLLQLDADEELMREDIPLLKQYLNSSEYNGLNVIFLNKGPDNSLYKHRNARVFRNGFVHYEGIVHNLPIVKGPVAVTPVRILHHGYNLSSEQMEKKFKRSEKLLVRQVEDHPNYTYGWANLIRNYRLQQQYEKVIITGEKVLSQFPSMPIFDRQMIMNDLMYGYFITNRIDEALQLGQQGLIDNPYHLDMLFIMGSCCIKKEQYAEAIQFFIKFLEVREAGTEVEGLEALIIDTYGFQARAWNNIGSCFKDLGDLNQAQIAYHKAIEMDGNTLFQKNLASIYIQMGQLDEAMMVLSRAHQLDPADQSLIYFIERIKDYMEASKQDATAVL